MRNGASEMAFDRKTFKNRLLGILSGALAHYYMIELADRNKQTKWVHHWRGEVRPAYQHGPCSGPGHRHQGPLGQAQSNFGNVGRLADLPDRSYRRIAANYVA